MMGEDVIGVPPAPKEEPSSPVNGIQDDNQQPQVGSPSQGSGKFPQNSIEENVAPSVPSPLAEDKAEIRSGCEVDSDKALHNSLEIGASEDEDDDDAQIDAEGSLPPGPIDPERCSASGPGFSGAAASSSVSLVLVAKDSAGRRIKEGGAYVLVYIEPKAHLGSHATADDDTEPIEAEVTDNKDGTYCARYQVPTKGNYELSIEVNGQPIGGSPFPVFFSAAEDGAAPSANHGQGGGGTTTTTTGTAGMQAIPSVPAMPPMLSSLPNYSTTGLQFSMGHQAAQLGVSFPSVEDSQLSRTVIIGGVSPFATEEALRAVFTLRCHVRHIQFAGPTKAFAFIEFESKGDADIAAGMTGTMLMGQALRVENALAARQATAAGLKDGGTLGPAAAAATAIGGSSAFNPFLAMQAQQVQAYQLMQQQQSALAQQVAYLRAAQSTGGGVHAALPLLGPKRTQTAGVDDDDEDKRFRRDERKHSSSRRHRDRSRSRSRDGDGRTRKKDQRIGRHRSRSRNRSGRRRQDDHRHYSDTRRRIRSRSRSRKDGRRRRRSRSRSESRDRRRLRSRSRDTSVRHYHRSREENGDRRRSKEITKAVEEEKQSIPSERGGNGGAPATPEDELEALLNELEG